MSKRPNILFMLSDDHAVQAISALGSKVNNTPNIDRLASEGGAFEQSFCCNSICTPSRASILTGMHSFQNGVLTLAHSLNPCHPTFPGLLREAGYTTAIVGKWHLNCTPKDFDFWKVLPGQGNYYNPDYLTPEGRIRESGYAEDLTTDTIIDWLRHTRASNKPFLACCHFKAPHRSWYPPLRHLHSFNDISFPEPENIADDYSCRCPVLKTNELMLARHLFWNTDLKVFDPGPNLDRLGFRKASNASCNEYEFDRMSSIELAAWDDARAGRRSMIREKRMDDREFLSWVYNSYLQDYLGCVAAIDDNVGRLLDVLEEDGLAENTIVVYCSDQGFYLGEHGWYDKRWIFEESMRMPLLIRWPGTIPPNARYTQLVQNIDYAPTFLDACGVEIPAGIQGSSLKRVIEGADIHDDLYYHYYAHGEHGVPAHDGIRTKRHKLIHFYTENEFNLFDLEQDPMEMRSVHGSPDYAGVLKDMLERYRNARQRFKVPDEFPPTKSPWTVSGRE